MSGRWWFYVLYFCVVVIFLIVRFTLIPTDTTQVEVPEAWKVNFPLENPAPNKNHNSIAIHRQFGGDVTPHLMIPKEVNIGNMIVTPVTQSSPFRHCTNLTEDFTLNENAPKPDFFFVGVAKGGSTSLYHYLAEHPQISEVHIKEPNFFTFPWVFRLTPTKYQNFYNNIDPLKGTQFKGDFSTSYLLHPLAPKRIYSSIPTAKIVIFLRNPIDRAYSHYVMQKRGNYENQTFEFVVEQELKDFPSLRTSFRNCFNAPNCDLSCCQTIHSHRVLDFTEDCSNDEILKKWIMTAYLISSVYDDQIERYLRVFPREQLFITSSEQFYEQPNVVMNEILKFLGITEHDFTQDGTILDKIWGGGPSNNFGPREYDPIDSKTRRILKNFFEPYNQRLYSLLGTNFGWE